MGSQNVVPMAEEQLVFQKHSDMSLQEALNLQESQPEKFIFTPPVRPKGGDILLFTPGSDFN